MIFLCNFAAKIRIFFNVLIMERIFLEEEIPYEKMEKLGIGRTQLLKMPRDILEPLMNGRITPLIMTNYKAENGKVISMPMKLQLVRDESGTVNLMTYQVRKEMERGQVRLSNKEAEKLKEGGVLRKELRTDGIRKMKYIQLDRETNSLMIREAASIRISDRLRNVEKLKDIELGTNQKQAVMEGKPVELSVGDQKVTVGVDLREPHGFKVVNGDMNEWERQMKIKYDHEHEGFMGYVLTDENRWEYQKVVEHLSHKEEKTSLKKEEKRSSGLKL